MQQLLEVRPQCNSESNVAVQVCQHIQAIARPCGVWAAVVIGGLSPLKQACAARVLVLRKTCFVQAGHVVASMRHAFVHAVRMQRMDVSPETPLLAEQERQLSKSPAIVVATPGRLWDLMQNGGGEQSR